MTNIGCLAFIRDLGWWRSPIVESNNWVLINFVSRTELSKAHAKLSLRRHVSVEDAVAACRIYEANVASLTGFAPFAASSLRQHLFNVDQNFADDVRPSSDHWHLLLLLPELVRKGCWLQWQNLEGPFDTHIGVKLLVLSVRVQKQFSMFQLGVAIHWQNETW